jgi:adenosine deaminase
MDGLPKVELHLHLEGAAPPAFVRRLAAEKKIDLSGIFDAAGNYAIRDFWHFLKVYEAATTTLQSPQDFYRLTLAVLEESAASGVVYTEAFLSPDFCGGRDLAAWRDYLAAIAQAAAEAEHSTSAPARRGRPPAARPRPRAPSSPVLASPAMRRSARQRISAGRSTARAKPGFV